MPKSSATPGDCASGSLRCILMDALSAVLAPVRLQQTCWAFTIGRAPWGIAFTGAKSCVRFHYIVRGSASLRVRNSHEPDVALSGGDLAVVPLGDSHVLRRPGDASPGRRITPEILIFVRAARSIALRAARASWIDGPGPRQRPFSAEK